MRYGISVVMLLTAGQTSFAQPVVQQPVVGVTSVNTSVSVPDRGSMFLGGVSSAQSGRSQYGPLRSGTSSGFTRQSSSISTNVYIIDLQAMDEAILNSRRAPLENGRPGTSFSGSRKIDEAIPEIVVSPTEKVKQHEELAQKADKAGKRGVAKLHWQMAAKYGSKVAEKRLAELSLPSPRPSTQATAR